MDTFRITHTVVYDVPADTAEAAQALLAATPQPFATYAAGPVTTHVEAHPLELDVEPRLRDELLDEIIFGFVAAENGRHLCEGGPDNCHIAAARQLAGRRIIDGSAAI